MTGWEAKIVVVAIGLSICATHGLAENKSDKDVAYGTHERHVLDVYWNTDYKNAPIVFTIHGGGFTNGNKSYCSKNIQNFYREKGCIVVSPNYRLRKEGTPITIADCTIDVAMAVAYMQANAEKYGGDPEKIVSTGSSAGGYLSAQIAYRKQWNWPSDAMHQPEVLNVIAWFGDSPYLPPYVIQQVAANDAPGFIMYGGDDEHPSTPAQQGHDMQAKLKSKQIWNKMVYVDAMGHVPAQRILYSPTSRDQETYEAFNEFLDMVCYGKGEPQGGDVIEVGK
ncbi:alpha/beta hydrolase [Aureliella helgolandensis]|uniref:Phenmedipham hydrolase n=1 Tax=Aureliella helgolandensis TaxID=2527968 RepID=A0A518G3T6_9BACT|nr:alpha/beta hydrolase [Aureliella helgolandensis]QDV23235.1 Phenmedipham hydrolase [Aureliella helgolandensis]